jgi:hypothetical protein
MIISQAQQKRLIEAGQKVNDALLELVESLREENDVIEEISAKPVDRLPAE